MAESRKSLAFSDISSDLDDFWNIYFAAFFDWRRLVAWRMVINYSVIFTTFFRLLRLIVIIIIQIADDC